MTTETRRPQAAEVVSVRVSRTPPSVTTALGGFYLAMSGIHVGIVAADAETYRHFADTALFGFVRTGWSDVFMANPSVWGLLLALGEVAIGVLLLIGGRAARGGWIAVLVFQMLLMLFGWGFWLWSLPALAVLVLGIRHDWAQLDPGQEHNGRLARPRSGGRRV